VSAEVWLNPPKLKAFCVPRTKSADLSNRLPKRPVFARFYVRGGRRSRYGATQHISVVLTARTRRVPACDAGAGDKAHQGLRNASSGAGLFYAWLPRRQTEVCCNPPSHSLSDLPGPTTTGYRTLTTDGSTRLPVTTV
jgi:hypothetical protein